MLASIVIDSDGDMRFYNEKGELHRIDGPAVEFPSGSTQWIVNGKFHRLDGPACEYDNGNKWWYVNDKLYTEKKFKKLVGKLC